MPDTEEKTPQAAEMSKDEMPFVDQEGKESLNFQLTLLIAWAAMIVIAVITCGVGGFLAPLILAGNIVFCIMGAMKANEGMAYKYPFSIRLVK